MRVVDSWNIFILEQSTTCILVKSPLLVCTTVHYLHVQQSTTCISRVHYLDLKSPLLESQESTTWISRVHYLNLKSPLLESQNSSARIKRTLIPVCMVDHVSRSHYTVRTHTWTGRDWSNVSKPVQTVPDRCSHSRPVPGLPGLRGVCRCLKNRKPQFALGKPGKHELSSSGLFTGPNRS